VVSPAELRSGRILFPLALIVSLFLTGCGHPNQANIQLRKDNQLLQKQLDDAHLQLQMQGNVLRAIQAHQPTVATLPPDRLDKLFTTHGINFGKLTGPTDPTNHDEKQGFVVYVNPVDQSNQRLKAAGSFTVEAFDLAAKGNPRLGRWTFSRDESAKLWAGFFVFDYYYVLKCPWQQMPAHPDVLIRVAFTDELTQLTFTADDTIHVQLPPPTMPSTAPATAP
jgi:hypothetical protein